MTDDRIKRPAYQWYVNDARGDEVFMLMSYEQQGIYRALLDHQWIEGSIPADLEALASILGIRKVKFARLWPLVSSKFRPQVDHRLVNEKLDKQRRDLDDFVKNQSKSGERGAAKRWGRHSKPIASPIANHSSSSSTSTSKTVSTEQKQEPAEHVPSPVKAFLTWFRGEYAARRNGAMYFVKWEAHGAIVKRLLTTYPPERLKRLAVILLTTNEEWTQSTDRGIEVLIGKISWLEERLAAWEAKQHAREAV